MRNFLDQRYRSARYRLRGYALSLNLYQHAIPFSLSLSFSFLSLCSILATLRIALGIGEKRKKLGDSIRVYEGSRFRRRESGHRFRMCRLFNTACNLSHTNSSRVSSVRYLDNARHHLVVRFVDTTRYLIFAHNCRAIRV